MTKIKIENNKLKKIVEVGLPHPKQLVFPIRFTPEKAVINYLQGKILCMVVLYPNFFSGYNCKETESFLFRRDMLKLFSLFKSDVSAWTDSKGFHVKEPKRHLCCYSIPIKENLLHPQFQTKIVEGLVTPARCGRPMRFDLKCKIDASGLKGRFTSKKQIPVELKYDGKILQLVRKSRKSQTSRDLKPNFIFHSEPICATFNYEGLVCLAKQFDGEVFLRLGRVGLALSQSSIASRVTYLLLAERVEAE